MPREVQTGWINAYANYTVASGHISDSNSPLFHEAEQGPGKDRPLPLLDKEEGSAAGGTEYIRCFTFQVSVWPSGSFIWVNS